MPDQNEPSRTIEPQGRIAPPTAPASGTDTVTVACKLPSGISFALGEMVEDYEPVMGGGQKAVKRFAPSGDAVVLRGPARTMQAMRHGTYPDSPLAGGYALNPGIKREHWEQVERNYKAHPALVNGLVFARRDDSAAIAEARNLHLVETGFEGIDPADPAKKTGMKAIQAAPRASAG